MKYFLSLVGCCLFLSACSGKPHSKFRASQRAVVRPVDFDSLALIEETALDRRADPCEDFYEFSCGNWLKHPIPADKVYIYRDYPLRLKMDGLLREIASAYAEGNYSVPSTYAKQVGNFYGACMDSQSKAQVANAENLLHTELSKIDAVSNETTLAAEIAELHLIGANFLFNFTSSQSFNDATQMVPVFYQGGMALPDRDYYLQTSPQALEILTKYQQHISNIFKLSGYDPMSADKASQKILKIESALAKEALSLDDRRDPANLNHPMAMKDVAKVTTHFDWSIYLDRVSVAEPASILVTEPKFLAAIEGLLNQTSLDDLKLAMKWSLLALTAPFLNSNYQSEYFHFWKQTLIGQESPEPEWQRCIHLYQGALKEALGEAYVKKYFSPIAKQKVKSMIDSIVHVFSENLNEIDWLDASTRQTALEKLSKVNKKVGYPDRWKSLDGLSFSRDNFLSDILVFNRFSAAFELSKIGKPVPIWQWDMAPHEINAYYNASLNEIVFPAGILQPPYFDLQASFAANMGNTGSTMGHELTHGFDDEGSKYDAVGNVKDWWSSEIRARFKERAQCLADQAASYPTGLDVSIRGQATLGENIADQGGIKLSLRAFLEDLSTRAEGPRVAGLNEIQQFFVAYGQGWCFHQTTESLRNQLLTDPHPPAEYRVNGVVKNVPEFSKAFACHEGKSRLAKDRCGVW